MLGKDSALENYVCLALESDGEVQIHWCEDNFTVCFSKYVWEHSLGTRRLRFLSFSKYLTLER